MVIHTSALPAIRFGGSEVDRIVAAIAKDRTRLVSAVSVLEASVGAFARKGTSGRKRTGGRPASRTDERVPFDREQMDIARAAYRRFGKGFHPAALNLGDCCAYALAVKAGEPLLYKGRDFDKTDVRRVTY